MRNGAQKIERGSQHRWRDYRGTQRPQWKQRIIDANETFGIDEEHSLATPAFLLKKGVVCRAKVREKQESSSWTLACYGNSTNRKIAFLELLPLLASRDARSRMIMSSSFYKYLTFNPRFCDSLTRQCRRSYALQISRQDTGLNVPVQSRLSSIPGAPSPSDCVGIVAIATTR
jgi:hypothetical protein